MVLEVTLLELVELGVGTDFDVNEMIIGLGQGPISSSSLSWMADCSRLCVCWITNTMIVVTAAAAAANAVSHVSGNPAMASATPKVVTARVTTTVVAARDVR